MKFAYNNTGLARKEQLSSELQSKVDEDFIQKKQLQPSNEALQEREVKTKLKTNKV